MNRPLTYPTSLALLRMARADSSYILSTSREEMDWGLVSPGARGKCRREQDQRDVLLITALEQEEGRLRSGLEIPVFEDIHELVPNARTRTHHCGFVQHVCDRAMPANAFRCIYRRGFKSYVLVESPAMVVLHAARQLNLSCTSGSLSWQDAVILLADLINELCGTYTRDAACPGTGSATYNLQPAASVSEIRSDLAAMHGCAGLTLARDAARHAADRLASPMESLLHLALCLPSKMGGLALRAPRVNVALRMGQREKEDVSHAQLGPDFYWPEYHTAIEYNGEGHETEESSLEDQRRVNDYQTLGLKVFFVNRTHLVSGRALSRVLLQVADALGESENATWRHRKRTLIKDSAHIRAVQRLLKVLMGPRPAWL